LCQPDLHRICRLLPSVARFDLRGAVLTVLYSITYNDPAPHYPVHLPFCPSALPPISHLYLPLNLHPLLDDVGLQPFHEALSSYGPDGCALPPRLSRPDLTTREQQSDNLLIVDARPLSLAAHTSCFSLHESRQLQPLSLLAVRSFSTTGESAQRLTLPEAHPSLDSTFWLQLSRSAIYTYIHIYPRCLCAPSPSADSRIGATSTILVAIETFSGTSRQRFRIQG
jgi:hypothetical protein